MLTPDEILRNATKISQYNQESTTPERVHDQCC